MAQPSLSTVVCVNTQPSLHSRVRARCPSILPVRPSVSAATTGTWTPSISTRLRAFRIHFHNVLFKNHGQDELFGATDFLLVPLGDLRANSLGGAFDGFGGDIQAGQQFHRLAGRSERHLTAHHSLHAPYARRGLQTSDTQFDVSRVLSFRAMGAE